MKTTIKLTQSRSVVVTPQKPGGNGSVLMYLGRGDGLGAYTTLTSDQAGALMFALEMACEAHEKAAA